MDHNNTNLAHTLLSWAERTPDAVFLRDLYARQTLSYSEAACIAQQIAARLLACGNAKAIAIALPFNHPAHILASLGAWLAGWRVALLPLTSGGAAPTEIVAAQLQCLEADIIVRPSSTPTTSDFDQAYRSAYSDTPSPPSVWTIRKLFSLDPDTHEVTLADLARSAAAPTSSSSVLTITSSPTAEAYRLFTSGAVNRSTVKAVCLSHAALHANIILWLQSCERMACTAHNLGVAPLHHSVGFHAQVCMSLATGGTYIFIDPCGGEQTSTTDMTTVTAPSRSDQVLKALLEVVRQDIPCNVVRLIPSLLERVVSFLPASLDEDDAVRIALRQRLQSMAYLAVTGSSCSKSLYDWARAHAIPMADAWGMSEVQLAATGVPLLRADGSWPNDLPANAVVIPNALFDRLEEGERLQCRGDIIFSGYVRPVLNATSHSSQASSSSFDTGDLFESVRSIESGQVLAYSGRSDDLIQLTNGNMVLATTVEEEMCQDGSVVKRAYVTGNVASEIQPSAMLVALVVLADGVKPSDVDDHLAWVNTHRLAAYARLARHNITIVAALPMTHKGAVHRKQIKADGADGVLAQLRGSCAKRLAFEALTAVLGGVDAAAFKDEALVNLALTSVQAAALSGYIARSTGIVLPVSIFGELQTVTDVQEEVARRAGGGAMPEPTSIKPAPLQPPTPSLQAPSGGVGIRGLSMRLPGGVSSMDDLWHAFVTGLGTDGQQIVVGDRGQGYGAPLCQVKLDRESLAWWDAEFFKTAPEEALFVKPQQRIAMELAYEALQDALLAPSTLKGKRVGVFCAADTLDGYEHILKEALGDDGPSNKYWGHGLTGASLPGRISHFFGFEGPSTMIETACSASLVAMHAGQRALLNGDCDLALVGAVTAAVNVDHPRYMLASNMASKRGVSLAFGQEADGMLPADGAMFCVLQRTDDAHIQDADALLYCTLESIQTRHQGASANMAMTRADAQHGLHQDVLRAAHIHAQDIAVFEAHGTGTSLGDGVEARAIELTFNDKSSHSSNGGDAAAANFILSSSKTVFGHTFEAAGLLGVTKAALCLDRGVCPPHHVADMHTAYDFARYGGTVPHAMTPIARPTYAMACSYGFSGIMAAAVIKKRPSLPSRTPTSTTLSILFLSAPNEARLTALATACAAFLKRMNYTPEAVSALQSTINAGRDVMAKRKAVYVVVDSTNRISAGQQLADALRAPIDAASPSRLAEQKGIVVQFAGTGRVRVDACRSLYKGNDVFRQAFDRVADVFALQDATIDVRTVLYPASVAYQAKSESTLQNDTRITQPCQFCLSYALYEAMLEHVDRTSIKAVYGHSFGEIAAACASGLLTLEEACTLVRLRSVQCANTYYNRGEKHRGAMVAIRASRAEVEKEIARLDSCNAVVAAINDDDAVTASGTLDDIEQVRSVFSTCRDLRSCGVAFHHPRLRSASSALEAWQASVPRRTQSSLQASMGEAWPLFVSCTTGKRDAMPNWTDHLVEPVEYSETARSVEAQFKGAKVIEVGLASELTSLRRRATKKDAAAAKRYMSLFALDGSRCLEQTLGDLFEAGIRMRWQGPLQRASIAQTLWERQRFWPPSATKTKPPKTIATKPFVWTQEIDATSDLASCLKDTIAAHHSHRCIVDDDTLETFAVDIQGRAEIRLRIHDRIATLMVRTSPIAPWQLAAETGVRWEHDDDYDDTHLTTASSRTPSSIGSPHFTTSTPASSVVSLADTFPRHIQPLTSSKRQPLVGDAVVEGDNVVMISAESHPTLAEHVVREQAILPAAAYIEMASELVPYGSASLVKNMQIERPLSLAVDASRRVLIQRSENGDVDVRTTNVDSQKHGPVCASFNVRAHSLTHVTASFDLAGVKARTKEVDLATYNRGKSNNFSFGRAFERLEEVRFGLKESLVRIRGWSTSETTSDTHDKQYRLAHPAVLDAVLQAPTAMMFGDGGWSNVYYLPSGAEQISLPAEMAVDQDVWAHAKLVSYDRSGFHCNIEVWPTDEHVAGPLLEFKNMHFTQQRADVEIAQQEHVPFEEHYETVWQPWEVKHAINKFEASFDEKGTVLRQRVVSTDELALDDTVRQQLIAYVHSLLSSALEHKRVLRVLCIAGQASNALLNNVSERCRQHSDDDSKQIVHCVQRDARSITSGVDLASFDLIVGVCLDDIDSVRDLLCPGAPVLSLEPTVDEAHPKSLTQGKVEGLQVVQQQQVSENVRLIVARKQNILAHADGTTVKHVFAYSIGQEMALRTALSKTAASAPSRQFLVSRTDEDFAAATALCRCLRNEMTEWSFVSLFVPAEWEDDHVQRIVASLDSQSCESEIRFEQDGTASVPRVVKSTGSATLAQQPSFSSDKVHLLIGGVSGLGIELAHWLYKRGARKFALTSRSGGKSLRGDSIDKISALRSLDALQHLSDVQVDLQAVDGSDAEAMTKLVSQCPSIGSVFIMPLVLDSRLFSNHTEESFARLFSVKHKVIRVLADVLARAHKQADMVVYFSTFGAVLGGPGQTNYYAASHAGEAAMARLHNGISVAVPGISDAGAFHRERLAGKSNIHTRSTSTVYTTQRLFTFLDRVSMCVQSTEATTPTTMLPPLPWSELSAEMAQTGVNLPLPLQHLVREVPVVKTEQDQHDDDAGNGEDGDDSSLAAFVSKALAMDADELDEDQPISFYGLDSLDAMLLSRRLRDRFGVQVAQLRLLSDITLREIQESVDKQGGGAKRKRAAPAAARTTVPEPSTVSAPTGVLNRIRDGSGDPIVLLHDGLGLTSLFRTVDKSVTRPLWCMEPSAALLQQAGGLEAIAEAYIQTLREEFDVDTLSRLSLVSYSGSASIGLFMASLMEERHGVTLGRLFLTDYVPDVNGEHDGANGNDGLSAISHEARRTSMLTTLPILVRASEIDVFGDATMRRKIRKGFKGLLKHLNSGSSEEDGADDDDGMKALLSDKAPRKLLSLMSLTPADRQSATAQWGRLRTPITYLQAQFGLLQAAQKQGLHTDAMADALQALLATSAQFDVYEVRDCGHFSIVGTKAFAKVVQEGGAATISGDDVVRLSSPGGKPL